MRALAAAGGRYLVGQSLRAGREAYEEALGRPGRYRKAAENLRVKEVTVGAGERRRRYAVCHNPQEVERQKRHRERVLEELEAELGELAEGRRKAGERTKREQAEATSEQGECEADAGSGKSGPQRRGHRQRECALRASGRYGKYLKTRADGSLAIDRKKVHAAERRDGKFMVHGNDDTLSGEDMALGYKQLQRVEQACGDTWRNIRNRLKRIQLAQLLSGEKTVWQVTKASEEARNLLQKLHLDEPAPILKID